MDVTEQWGTLWNLIKDRKITSLTFFVGSLQLMTDIDNSIDAKLNISLSYYGVKLQR